MTRRSLGFWRNTIASAGRWTPKPQEFDDILSGPSLRSLALFPREKDIKKRALFVNRSAFTALINRA